MRTNGLIANYRDNTREVVCNHTGNRVHKNEFTYFDNYYTYPSKPSYTIIETIEQETNTYKYGITLADCWFVKLERNITQEGAKTEPTQTNDGELSKGKYTFLKETKSTGNAAINNIKSEQKKDDILNSITTNTNRIKQGISVPNITFDFGTLGVGAKVNVSHNVNIKRVVVAQQTSSMGGVQYFSATPMAKTATVSILANTSSLPDSTPIMPIRKIEVEDVNGNKFEFDGVGNATNSRLNVTREDELTLQTYEYIKTDGKTSTVIDKTKYPVTEGETKKELYDNKNEKFLKAYGESGKAKGNIGSTPGWLEEMIDEFDPNFTTIVRYLIDMYKYGHSKVDIDKVLDLYDEGSFKTLGGGAYGGGFDQFKRWLRTKEGNEGISADGTLYKVGLVGGNETVGYGIDLKTSRSKKQIKRINART